MLLLAARAALGMITRVDPGILDRLQALGCNITIAGYDGFVVVLTLQHDGDCGHNGRGRGKFEAALQTAVHGLLKAATGSRCGVDLAELRRIALAVGTAPAV